mmetsp:Transcript_2520/g.10832  ORF Transcript_2520/g.10832 Transcript_2520/m.10832 type:complete len:257 (+) Transcript_2520:42-812(+)
MIAIGLSLLRRLVEVHAHHRKEIPDRQRLRARLRRGVHLDGPLPPPRLDAALLLKLSRRHLLAVAQDHLLADDVGPHQTTASNGHQVVVVLGDLVLLLGRPLLLPGGGGGARTGPSRGNLDLWGLGRRLEELGEVAGGDGEVCEPCILRGVLPLLRRGLGALGLLLLLLLLLRLLLGSLLCGVRIRVRLCRLSLLGFLPILGHILKLRLLLRVERLPPRAELRHLRLGVQGVWQLGALLVAKKNISAWRPLGLRRL